MRLFGVTTTHQIALWEAPDSGHEHMAAGDFVLKIADLDSNNDALVQDVQFTEEDTRLAVLRQSNPHVVVELGNDEHDLREKIVANGGRQLVAAWFYPAGANQAQSIELQDFPG